LPGTEFSLEDARIAVLGLGYVGLPLAIEFGTKYPTIGLDIDADRIKSLERQHDATLEVEAVDFARAPHLTFTMSLDDIRSCTIFIVTVPTPIDAHKQPNMRPLEAASRSIGEVLKRGDVVIYESTVYPRATEEVCVPLLEGVSGLGLNDDFFVGYSPERINPGEKVHQLTKMTKVTSGSTPESAKYVDALYSSIITAGTHRGSSIAIAEAAKVIENTQRDLNIALINELALIFERLGIDTEEVLEAAGTKWNFLNFRPGLVGGHCIGVDPYYLTHKAETLGYHPEVILAGRRINDHMGEHIADRIIKLMTKAAINVVGAKVLVLGLTFKENCPDIRNTKVVDVIEALGAYHVEVNVHDPWVDPEQALYEYGIRLEPDPQANTYDAVVVAHDEFKKMSIDAITNLAKKNNVIFDVKNILPQSRVTGRL